MHHTAWSTIVPLALALATALATTTVHADCLYVPMKQRPQRVEAIYLGHYVDLLGNRASFYFDSKTSRVLGPIDHDARKPAPNAKPGQIGTLTFRAMVPDPPPVGNQPINAGHIASMGFYDGFAGSGANANLPAIVARISDSLVIGLLAGDASYGGLADRQLAALAAAGDQRHELAIAMQGVLYAATKDRAVAMFKSYRYHDLFGGDPSWAVILKHEGLAGIEARAKGTAAGGQDWLAYLPDLAVAWKQKANLDGKLDDLLLGNDTPGHPFIRVDRSLSLDGGCGPTRQQIHGPFQGRGDVSQHTVVDMLAKIDPAFVNRLEPAFARVTAASNAIVLDVRVVRGRTLVTGTQGGEIGVVEVDPKQAASIARGTRLAIVARRAPGGREYVAIPHLAQNESVVRDAGTATRLTVLGKDEAGLIASLRGRVLSGNSPHSAGLALATLFDLTSTVGSWKIDELRKAIWSLPGNSYGTAKKWAGAWREILMYALRYSTNRAFAAELERSFPMIIQNFARQHGNKRATTIDAEPVRGFAIEVGIQLALLYVRTGDLPSAERVLAAANGPLTAYARVGTPIGPEAQRDSNRDAQLRIARVLVRGLQKRDARDLRPPNPDHLNFDVTIFNHVVRAYAPSLKKAWQQAVVVAGHPEPPLYD